MKEELQVTAFDTLEVSRGSHLCHFYETKADLLDTLVPYLKAGLDNHEFCMWVIPDSFTFDEAVEALAKLIPDIHQRRSDGEIEIISHQDWYLSEGFFNLSQVIDGCKNKLKHALDAGFTGFRVTGDISWALGNGWRDFSEYEKAVDNEIRKLNMTALCTYPLGICNTSQVLDVVGTHQSASTKRKGQLEVIEASATKMMKAEIEQLNQQLESRVLKRTRELANANAELLKEIAERKRAEAQLSDSEAFRRMVIEAEPECVKLVSKDCTVLEMNPAGLAMVEADSRDQVIGLSVLGLVVEGSRDAYRKLNRRVFQGETAVAEFEILGLKGTRRWMETHAAPVLDNEGQVTAQLSITRDITEQKRAEEALRKTELKYRNIFENSGEGIFQTSPDGMFLTANPALARMFGFESAQELIESRTDIARQHYVDPARRQELTRMLEQNENTQDFEYEAYRKDGSKIRINALIRAVRDENGELLYYEGTAQDITERRRAEDALRKQTESLQKILDHLPMMIRLSGEDGKIHFVNRGWEETLGWTLAEVQNHEAEVYSKIVLEDERERVQQFMKNASGEWEDFHTRLRDGRTIDTSWAVVTLSDGVSIGIGQDITERKRADEALREAEQKYRELFENAKDAMYVHDLEGRYVSVNRAAEELSGYSREEILGKHFVAMVAPEYVYAVKDHLSRKLGIEGETSYEVEVISKDGRRIPVEVSSRLIRKNGVAIGVQGTARDITERKLAAQVQRQYSRRLIQAQEEERQRIARELHDQIGQILTAVQFNLHTVQRLCPTSDAAAHVDDGIRVLDEALEQVRDLSLDLRPALLDDLGLVPALRWYLGRQARRTGLKPDIFTDLPHADLRFTRDIETACFRIAQEALTNVVRHAHATKVTIHLGLDDSNLRLAVNDNGVGLDADALRKRVLRAPTLGFQGMQERAEAVKGSFWIVSAPGKGTEVNASFPVKT